MTLGLDMTEIAGWAEVVEWFGFEPTFHDAEVASIDFRRGPLPTVVCVHVWRVTSEIDAQGVYVRDRHAAVKFVMTGVDTEVFEGWNHQNVLMDISFTRRQTPQGDGRIVTHFNSIFGLEARFIADTLVLELIGARPANPTDAAH